MPTVLIVGGGYAGLRAARDLAHTAGSRVALHLLDRHDEHQLTSRLPEIVGGRIRSAQALIPFRRLLPPDVPSHRVTVHSIDAEARKVETDRGTFGGDWLIIALGSISDFLGVPGASSAAVLRTVRDAERLRSQIEVVLSRRATARVVIVGAGYTGSEVAGELAAWSASLRETGRSIHVSLVAQDDRLLPQGNRELGRIAERVLTRQGVTMHLGAGVRNVFPGHLDLMDGSRLEADVVLWAAHSRAWPLCGNTARAGVDGRVVVDPYLQAEGLSRVFVAGDTALAYDYVHDRVASSSAQLAVQQGALVARNLAAALEGRPLREYRPHILGEALSLGRDGAAEVGGVVVTGRAALAVKDAALVRYLRSLGGVRFVSEYA